MCNYDYKIENNYRKVGDECPYPRFFEALRAGEQTPRDIDLPIDRDGTCLFHSTNAEWKMQNDFTAHFLDLIHLLDAHRSDEPSYNFAGFMFTPDFALKDAGFKKEAVFSGASFAHGLSLVNVRFERGAAFNGAAFRGSLAFKNVSFEGADFTHARFLGIARFDEVDFAGSYALFSDSEFFESAFFDNSRFLGMTDFSNATFRAGERAEAALQFQDVVFDDFTSFAEATFNRTVEISRTTFNANAEFVDTSFGATASTARFRTAAVSFQDVDLGENGFLVLRSTDPQKKLFAQEAAFRFKDGFRGTVLFENVNFFKITYSSRVELLRLSKLGKVEIGPGCIKYRLQTPIRTIEADAKNQNLILEIAQTFTNYFTAEQSLNLGIEITERDGDKLSFFYFSDENITEEEFLDRLAKSEQNLWSLLTADFDGLLLLGDGVPATARENPIINAVDGISALLGTFFRAGIRIAFGKWSQSDTRALVDVVDFGGRPKTFGVANLHRDLLARYNGRRISSINQFQNKDILRLGPAETAPVTEILFLGSSPAGSPLQLGREVKKIEESLRVSKNRDRLKLVQQWAVTPESLLQALLDTSPEIIHFSGHGTVDGIFLQDDHGQPRLATNEALSGLFKQCREGVRCVLLSSCYSEHQARVIREHVPYVVGMRSGADDELAIKFSEGFYRAVGAGKDIPYAFNTGVLAIKLSGRSDADVPVLL